MEEELHRYELRSPHLPNSPPAVRTDTPPGHGSRMYGDLKLSHFSGDSEGSAVVDLTMLQPITKRRKHTDYFKAFLRSQAPALAAVTSMNTNIYGLRRLLFVRQLLTDIASENLAHPDEKL